MEEIKLFENKSQCCGCGACMNICPRKAIIMKEDKFGFLYPSINSDLCIKCGACKRVCGFQNIEEKNEPMHTYVACTQTTDITQSASGGVFASIAKSFIENNGLVYGVSMELINNELIPMHICVDNIEDLPKLQGSKYVQSKIGNTYTQVKQQLTQGRNVLFSGTPCQVAGLKSFLGNKEYDNLFLIDIVCHGVPSIKFFNSYLRELEHKLKGTIIDFKFRDKSRGWGLVGKVSYLKTNNERKSKYVFARESSYYQLFLKGDIYRENCYECKYASQNRPGDITLGDYWGIEKEHPDYLIANGGEFDECKGISCMIVNSAKAEKLIEELSKKILIKESTFEKVARQNGQLVYPTKRSERREEILEKYTEQGYKQIDKWFKSTLGIKFLPIFIIDRVPVSLKKQIRRIIK